MSAGTISEKRYKDEKEAHADFKAIFDNVWIFKEKLDEFKRKGKKREKEADISKKWIADNMKILSKNLKSCLEEETQTTSRPPDRQPQKQPFGSITRPMPVDGKATYERESSVDPNSSTSGPPATEPRLGDTITEDKAAKPRPNETDIGQRMPEADRSVVETDDSTSNGRTHDKDGKNQTLETEARPSSSQTVSEKVDTNDKLKRTLKQRESELEEYHKDIGKLQTENENLKKEVKDLKESLGYQKQELDGVVSRRKEVEMEFADAKEKMEEQHSRIKQQELVIEDLKRDIETKTKSADELMLRKTQYKDTFYRTEADLKKLQVQFDKVATENKDLHSKNGQLTEEVADLVRSLGTFASDKIQQDNHNVADLGDPDRAQKITERYNEFYDKTWTNEFRAHRKTTSKRDKEKEKETVKLMLNVLKSSFVYCEEVAKIQEDSLRNILVHPVQQDMKRNQTPEDIQHQPVLLFKMKDLRKKFSIAAEEEVKQAFWDRHRTKKAEVKDDGSKAIDISKEYYRKCVEICWRMVLHNPPLYMDFDIEYGSPVKTEFYEKRSSGDVVETLVWPPLFLGKHGDLLTKGVVEAIRTVKKKDV